MGDSPPLEPAHGQAGLARRASAADLPGIARTLARAFDDDPVAMWSCRPERRRPPMLERFFAIRAKQLLADREIWVTAGLQSAALWAPPTRWRITARESLALVLPLMHPHLAWRLPLVTVGLGGMEARHPRTPPHWYLAVLGTDPAEQGRGLGSAVLAPVLEQCDSDQVGAYLESSKERNIAFYARHGFRVTGELRLPRGPTLWPMWRDPH
ncbi:MAG: GNAT family N-acetyltransferase [Solirubrobacteraceae bacterium]